MPDTTLLVTTEYSPNRCEALTSKGQCVNESLPNEKVCAMHGSNRVALRSKRNVEELYKWHFEEDMKSFSSARVMSLKAETGILRTTLHQLLKTCDTPAKLILNTGPISKLTNDIRDLIATIDRVNMNSGNLLDANDILQIAQDIVQAIGQEVQDPDMLQRLSKAILSIISARFSPDEVDGGTA